MRDSSNPDFIEALARGLDVIRALGAGRLAQSLSELSTTVGLARPTTRRILITLTELGYVRASENLFSLAPRVLELGMAYISAGNIWELSRPHLVELTRDVDQSCSIAQLDGCDAVYVSRVTLPKLVTLSVTVGTRFPAYATSLGKVLLAALTSDELEQTLALESRSDVIPSWRPTSEELEAELRGVRARGYALTDQQLAPGILSIAAPIRDGQGAIVAAININTHAFETSVETLTETYLPRLLVAATAISADWANWATRPEETLGR